MPPVRSRWDISLKCSEIIKMTKTVLQTNIKSEKVHHGKVRDIYDLGDKLLIVASDRLSAFDVIMENGIPFKGQVLTKISEFW